MQPIFYFCRELNTYILPVGRGMVSQDVFEDSVKTYTRMTGVPFDDIQSGNIHESASRPNQNTMMVFLYAPGQGILMNPNASVKIFGTMQMIIETIMK